MIDYEQARQIALDYIGPNCGLVGEAILEKPYGWYFADQSKAYLKSGDFRDMLFGSSGFIVEREDGRVFRFGSSYPSDVWLANYERGFKYHFYNLHITSIFDVEETVSLLYKLDMRYVVPEFAYGEEWKIPQRYTKEQIREAIQQLPGIFENQAFWHRTDVLDAITTCGCCAYEVTESRR